MRGVTSILLAGLLVVSTLFGLVAWLSPINPRESTFNWTVRIASAVIFPASLAALIYLHSRPEKVPDFLSKRKNLRIGRGGVVFVFDAAARDGWAWIEVYYQNRFANRGNVTIALTPSQNLFMKRNDIEPALFTFPCGPAAFGVVRVPMAIKREYQGKSQQFDVGADLDYPNGLGECLRNSVGAEISTLDFSIAKSMVGSLAKVAISGRPMGVRFQSRVTVTLPTGVAASASDTPDLVQEEFWTLANNGMAPPTA